MFNNQIKFIENFESILNEQFKESIMKHNLILKDCLIEKQLFDKGIDGNGKRLEGYTRTTIRYKLSKNQPADRTTLKDEGKFHAKIEINAFSDHFEIKTDVEYDKYILKRYGRNVLKLTNEHLKEFVIKYLIPNLKDYVNNRITK